MKTFLLTSLACFCFSYSEAQQKDSLINLIENGDFEKGNYGFTSYFRYNANGLNPGEYSITNNAARLNKELTNPTNGDHTTGSGKFLVANSNAVSSRKIWCSNVQVEPNSVYIFTAYFCNLYKKRPNNGFFQLGGVPDNNDSEIKITINNKQIGETEKDIFQQFDWLKATIEWYSGSHSVNISLCIENINTNSYGNDLALDDIQFQYLKTMPEGYEPVVYKTIMDKEYRDELEETRKSEKVSYLDFEKGDSLEPGIFSIYGPKKKQSTRPEVVAAPKLENMIFEMGKAYLLPEAKKELEKLVVFLNQNPIIRIRLEGHTDSIGQQENLVELSEKRAEAASEHLISRGINSTRIETAGFGGTQPRADNSDPELRAQNRRIEVVILK